MGGNALKNQITTRRYNREEFDKLSNEILGKSISVFPDAKIIPFYKNKESFGDLDIIVSIPPGFNYSFINHFIEKTFRPAGYSYNDKVYSFNVEELQVDLITVEPENYNTCLNYFSYNDLGNFVGRVAKGIFDLKYGHDGLTMPVRLENNNTLGYATVSKDTTAILSVLGFDPERFFAGFNELEEIFNYVIKSRYFKKDLFDLENLNHINRTRNRKRDSYMKFLEYIKVNNPPDREEVFSGMPGRIEMDYFIAYSGALEVRDELIKAELRRKEISNKFNGNLVMEWTGLKRKELNEVLKGYKFWRGMFSDFKSWEDFVENSPPEKIKENFMKFYQSTKEKND